MITSAKKWGNTTVVRITVDPVRETYKLDELLKGIAADHMTDFGARQGKEAC
jgi:antitoxin component of MazEF toxin-antitoxin module